MNVNVNIRDLRARLLENRETHRASYEKALAGYKIEARRELETELAKLGEGKEINRFLTATPPEDHTSDYDDVIDMLNMSTDTQIELTQQQFKQYARDDWGWKREWTTSNTSYILTAEGAR